MTILSHGNGMDHAYLTADGTSKTARTDKWPPYLTERPDEYGDPIPVNESRHNARGPVGTEEEAQAKGWSGPFYHGTTKRRARDIRRGGFRQPRTHNWQMEDYGDIEEINNGNTHRTFFADNHQDAHDFARSIHGDDVDVVKAYLHPQHHTTEEGGGFMPSTQVKDVAHAMAIRPQKSKKEARTVLPSQRLFGPTYGLDHRLFDGDKLRPEIREDIVMRFADFCNRHHYSYWPTWAKIVFFGSEASTWTSPTLEGNNDFDISIGIEYDRFRAAVPGASSLGNEEIAGALTEQMHAELNVEGEWFAVDFMTWPHAPSSISHGQSSSTSPVEVQQASQQRRGYVLPPSVEPSHWRGWSVATTEGENAPYARRVATAAPSWDAQSTPSSPQRLERSVPPASRHTSTAGTFDDDMDSRRSDSTRNSEPRGVDARSVVGRTSSWSWTTTTPAAQASTPAGSASEESSVLDAIKQSGISANKILGGHSVTWPSGPPPVRLPDGYQWIGPFSHTWFANQLGWDITQIRPYAAYDVVRAQWIVKPPELPGWDISQFPEGHGLTREIQGIIEMARGVLSMPEPYRTQNGDALWHYVHDNRSNAFGPQGEGWWDSRNVIEKSLDQKKLMQELYACHDRADHTPGSLDAPAGWSNDPSTVR